MNFKPPRIIQGGMGAGVSGWRLAQAVSQSGQLGVVSGTALDEILARRLQNGDIGGHIRRALEHFPFPKMAQQILNWYFVDKEDRDDRTPYQRIPMHTLEGTKKTWELCVVGNFVEVFLAREGHKNPVGINYLEKIQLPHLASLYGAMLAGVAVVIVGAGIPAEFPKAMEALAKHEPASYTLRVKGAESGEINQMSLDPSIFQEAEALLPPLAKPDFFPIISSATLGKRLCRAGGDGISGLIIEGPTAGGHNAPPRNSAVRTEDGQPVYGERDAVDLEAIRKLGLPFWLAGSYGSPERLQDALKEGASGVQVGTAFALSRESDLVPEVRQKIIQQALTGSVDIFTDPLASPAGFPFKVVKLPHTLFTKEVYEDRKRLCDLGYLREAYRKEDGSVGYRCPAEPKSAFVAKGGDPAETDERRCLCNALLANIGMPQRLADGTDELCLITLGDDLKGISRFCSIEEPDYSAKKVVDVLLG